MIVVNVIEVPPSRDYCNSFVDRMTCRSVSSFFHSDTLYLEPEDIFSPPLSARQRQRLRMSVLLLYFAEMFRDLTRPRMIVFFTASSLIRILQRISLRVLKFASDISFC